jgi:hypothetical protein
MRRRLFASLPRALWVLTLMLGCRKAGWQQIEAARPQLPTQKIGQAEALSPISIKELYPPSALSGIAFQVQPDGSSSVGVAGNGFTRTSVVYFDGWPLITNYQSPRAIAGLVPNGLISTPRMVTIIVRDPRPLPRESEARRFEVVEPPRTASPMIREIFPSSVCVGVPFGLLPSGNWSIGIVGSGFLPEAEVFLDKELLRTKYQGPTTLTAVVPEELVASPRTSTVTVRIPGTPPSHGVPLVVQP